MAVRAEWRILPEDLGSPPAEGFAARNENLSPPEQFRVSLQAFAEHVKKTKAEVLRIEDRFPRVIESIRQAIASADPELDFDELIEEYARVEEAYQRVFIPQIKEAREKQKYQLSLSVPPADRALSVRVWTQVAENSIRALELARDIRWAMMALRSTTEEGGSPIFSNPGELRDYLDQL